MKENKKLFYYAIICTSIIAILLSIIIILFSTEYETGILKNTILTQSATVIISVFCSIIASLIWSVLIDDKDSNIDLENLIANINNNNIPKIKFAPTKVYAGTNVTHKEFNDNLNNAISRTENYYYMGDIAKYLAKRLDKDITTTHDRLTVQVLLPDIADNTIFEARIKELKLQDKKFSHTTKLDSVIIKNEKIKVLQSIFLLKKLEDRYNIKIYLHKEIPMNRIEITDNMLVISILTAIIDGNYYPVTLVYENEKQLLDAYVDYLKQVKIRAKKIELEDITVEYLVNLAKIYIDENFSESEFDGCELIEGYERETSK